MSEAGEGERPIDEARRIAEERLVEMYRRPPTPIEIAMAASENLRAFRTVQWGSMWFRAHGSWRGGPLI